jgi:hypothetical protein
VLKGHPVNVVWGNEGCLCENVRNINSLFGEKIVAQVDLLACDGVLLFSTDTSTSM